MWYFLIIVALSIFLDFRPILCFLHYLHHWKYTYPIYRSDLYSPYMFSRAYSTTANPKQRQAQINITPSGPYAILQFAILQLTRAQTCAT